VGRELRREAPLLEAKSASRHAVATGADPVPEVRDRPGPERDVHIRIELENSLSLRLRVAAADGDDPLRVRALERGRLCEVSREALVGLLAHGACVEDDHVGVLL
jgi:hypothetical protein